MTTLYLTTYTAIARNVSTAELAAAFAAIPRDTQTESLLGFDSLTDATSINGRFVTRSFSYMAQASPMIPAAVLGQFLVNQYTTLFSMGLGTPVVQGPVSTIAVPSVPLLWVRADAGAPGAVSDWTDLSGNMHDLLQATGGEQPAVAVVDDLLAVHFSGAQLVATAASLPFDAFSYLVTFKTPLASTAGLLFERSVDATAHSGENLYQSASAPHSVLATRSATTHTADLAANWGVAGQWQFAAYTYGRPDGGAVAFAEQVGAGGSAAFAALPAEAASARLFVGARSGLALPLTGFVRELMVFASELTTAQLLPIAAYMQAQVRI